MRFRKGDIVKFSKNGRSPDCWFGSSITKSEGTIVTTSFVERAAGYSIHVKWDDGFCGDLCTENELRLVRRADAI